MPTRSFLNVHDLWYNYETWCQYSLFCLESSFTLWEANLQMTVIHERNEMPLVYGRNGLLCGMKVYSIGVSSTRATLT